MATPKGGLQHPRPTRVLSLRRIESFSGVEGKRRLQVEGVSVKDRMLGLSCDGSESVAAAGAGKAGKASSVARGKL